MSRSLPIVLALLLAACDGGEPPTGDGRPPPVTILAQNLELLPGDDNAIRIGFAPAGSGADIIVTTVPDTATITVCALRSVGDELPPRTACRVGIGSGVREPVSSPGLGAVSVSVTGETARANILLEFPERARTLELVVPQLRAPSGEIPCADNTCNPFFEMLPTRNGPFSASLEWEGPDASLLLLQGSVLGRSQTATGIPYREAARDDGASPLRIAGQTSAPGEYALAMTHRGAGGAPMRGVRLEASWPTSS